VTERSSVSGLFTHTFIYGLGDLTRKLVGFLLIPLYTRYMTPGEYGILQLSLVFIAFVQIPYSFGLTTAFFRFYLDSAEEERRRRVFATSFWSMAAIDTALSVAMLAQTGALSSLLYGDPGQGPIVVLVVLVLLVETLLQVPLLLLRALDRSRTFLLYVLAQLFVALVANYVCVVVFKMGAYGAMVANLFASSFLFVLLLPLTAKNARGFISSKLLKELFSFGLPFVPATLAILVMNISDQYLIRFYRGLEETGLYALSYKFGMAINLFITGFRYAWVPFIFRVSREPDAGRLYARAFEVTTVILSLVFFLICAFLPEMFAVMVDSSYFSGMGIVPFVALAYVLYGLHIIFLAGIYLENETAFIAKAGAASALANILANLVLIPRFGMWAAAGTTLFSFALLTALVYGRSQKVHRIPFDLGKATRVLFLAAVLLLLVRGIDWGNALVAIGVKVLALLSYLLILRGMGLVSVASVREILSSLTNRKHPSPVDTDRAR
jgi:O-antigen/teichoic acid export membrane protein